MANKRKYRRFTRRCESEFTAGGNTYRGIACDFSLAGMFIRTKHPLPPDSPLDITVHLPDGSRAELSGLVRRSAQPLSASYTGVAGSSNQKSGMGVELTERDANYLEFLRNLLGEIQYKEDEATRQAEATTSRLAPSGSEPSEKQEDTSNDEENISMRDLLVHLISSQQALINLLDKEGVINKKDIAQEMAKLRKK
jgi:hypothetical protein